METLARHRATPIRLELRLDDSAHEARALENLDQIVSVVLANVSRYGIEDLATRTALGKEPEARISLSARASGATIEVLLDHDGRSWRAALDEAHSQHGVETGIEAPIERCIQKPDMGVGATAERPAAASADASLLWFALFDATPSTGPGLELVLDTGKSASASPACILLVEDEPSLSILIENVLHDAGYHVHTARDGIEAIELLSGIDADAVITDIVMPSMNGIELLRRVRAEERWKALPMFVMTSAPERSTEALSAGARGVFVKLEPDWLDQLRDALASAIG